MRILLLGACYFMASCVSRQAANTPQDPVCLPASAFRDKLGEYEVEFSKTEGFFLAVVRSEPTAKRPESPVRFIVGNTVTCEILLEDQIANGSVEWISESEIEVHMIPGIVSKEEPRKPLGYRYHVLQRSKNNLSQSSVKKE